MGSAIYGDPTIRISALSCPAVAEAPMLSESYSASRQAYEKSGIGPEDIDVLELPDNSSWHYLVYLETCGFCKEGEADKMLRDGLTKIGGKLPVNPSGGFSSHGEALSAQALWQVIECANQLRGRCGERQVEGAKVAMARRAKGIGSHQQGLFSCLHDPLRGSWQLWLSYPHRSPPPPG